MARDFKNFGSVIEQCPHTFFADRTAVTNNVCVLDFNH